MNKVRWGIIGCDGMSRHHGKVFTTQVPAAEIGALSDPHADNLKRYQTEIVGPLRQRCACQIRRSE